MRSLDLALRILLERSIKKARQIAEDAARMVLDNLGVSEPLPLPHLNEKELELHQRLRIHGRQLGDVQDSPSGVQEIGLLLEEVAYEHWHRMLFARFLAENNLLMYPDPETPVAITLEECEELASKEGAHNGFDFAARFATKMLPQIFQVDSPVFELNFPPESSQKLERLLNDLPQEIFRATDSLGWVYQFWQSAKKDEVRISEVKIGQKELPAVTQVFTESYMVNFLLDNSLGAWWAGKRLTDTDFKGARNEDELRQKAALPGMPLEYLRFAKLEDGSWVPVAGFFPAWPEKISDLQILDPCCGSGHFLLAAFLILVPLRRELEGLSARDAVDAVLRENLYGLELDRRCLELAAFALALTAWKYEGARGYRPLPELNLACSGLSMNFSPEEWKKLVLGKQNLSPSLKQNLSPSLKKNLSLVYQGIYETFKDAKLLGSLLKPLKTSLTKLKSADAINTLLEQVLLQAQNEEGQEAAVVVHGLLKSLKLLTKKYHLVITNVPYLSQRKETALLKEYCKKNYPEAYYDLSTVFLERSLEFCVAGGTTNIVMPQNLLFLKKFENLRKKLLNEETWHLFACLGRAAFEFGVSGNNNIMLISLSRKKSSNSKSNLIAAKKRDNLGNIIHLIDVSLKKTTSSKAELLKIAEIKKINQERQLENPEYIIGLSEKNTTTWLNIYAMSLSGIQSGDDSHYRLRFFELPLISGDWVYWQSTSLKTVHFGGKKYVLFWSDDFNAARNNKQAYVRGLKAWGKKGLVIDQMGNLHPSIHTGAKHDMNCAIILPFEPEHLPAIWCFCSSALYNTEVRKINKKINVTNASLAKVPFELNYWTQVAKEKYPHGLPEPYSNDPTQWIFHGHPCGSVIWDEQNKQTVFGPKRIDDTVLHVAVARLLGYRWPAELDESQNLAKEQREVMKSCESLEAFTDKEGIVALPPLRGKPSAADRLLNLLAASYGNSWTNGTLRALLKSVFHADKSLESWLRDKFFTQHSKLFQNRPFIWHIWDGQKNGFAVLVNYHKLDYKLLETLIYTYLGDWISRQKNDISRNVDGAEELLNAALSLQKRLELILIGEAPYDIFVRWKPLEKQASGWNPDPNDGVRLNIRPFLTVPDVAKKNAGILRDKPIIHWKKDLGRDHESAPWYQTFKGDRRNDHHLTLAEKALEKPVKF
ncbi:MAG: SAM-dependent DNA methyltransferase [Deltaproteobacteria bacterium]|jgi:hypothetical protein|nr:SAM-dependent DNA methyltransferase [Deltaproteobacteria bacterium]